jgi:uncharacterized protein (DUF302 family)
MTINQLLKVPLALCFVTLSIMGCKTEDQNRLYQHHSSYGFEDTLLNLDIAIAEHNYRIIHRSHIGQAVRDRGEPNYPLSTITSFCNITYAREMMDINQDLINDMPCNVAVRETADGVIVSTKLMNNNTKLKSQNDFANKINTNLKSIVEATVE